MNQQLTSQQSFLHLDPHTGVHSITIHHAPPLHAPHPIHATTPSILLHPGESLRARYYRLPTTTPFPQPPRPYILSHRALAELAARFERPTDMDRYAHKPLPKAPSPRARSSSCKALPQLEPPVIFPRRSTSLPRLPSTSSGLELLTPSVYTPVEHRAWSGLPNDFNSRQKPLALAPPLAAYRGLVFRSTPQLPLPSPPLRRQDARANLNALTSHAHLPNRERFVCPPRIPQLALLPPTPGTSPMPVQKATMEVGRLAVSVPARRRRARREGGEKGKVQRTSLIAQGRGPKELPVVLVLVPEMEGKKAVRKRKRNSLAVYRERLPRQGLAPRTRRPRQEKEAAVGATVSEVEAVPPVPELPFTDVYKQILEQRWKGYREMDALRAEDEKRGVVEFLAKMDADAEKPVKAVARSSGFTQMLALSKTMAAESPKAGEEVKKRRFWEWAKRGERKRLRKKRVSVLPEEALKRISVYSAAGIRSLGF